MCFLLIEFMHTTEEIKYYETEIYSTNNKKSLFKKNIKNFLKTLPNNFIRKNSLGKENVWFMINLQTILNLINIFVVINHM